MTQASRQETLIVEHLDLVKSIAIGFAQTLPAFVELNDLIQAGMLGLIDAARRFDPVHQASFATYAKHRVRGAILDSLRSDDTLSRDMRAYQKKIDGVEQRFEQEHQRQATAQEIAAALGLEVRHLDAIRLRIHQAQETSIDQTTPDGLPTVDMSDRPENRPDAILERRRMQVLVREAIEALPHRDQTILHLYYTEEMSMREIGKVLGVNESRVSQLHKRAASALASHLKARPVARAAAA